MLDSLDLFDCDGIRRACLSHRPARPQAEPGITKGIPSESVFICCCSPHLWLYYFIDMFAIVRGMITISWQAFTSPSVHVKGNARRDDENNTQRQGRMWEGLSHLIFDTSNLSYPGGNDADESPLGDGLQIAPFCSGGHM